MIESNIKKTPDVFGDFGYIKSWPLEISVGLDIGSRTVKLVVCGPDGIIKKNTWESVPFVRNMNNNGGLDIKELGLDPAWPLVVTGYGKAALPQMPGISEIRAHFKGALAQTGLGDFTLVELGGQDSKVIHVEGGKVLDFVTNDRCAAGTGRYLENMARLMDTSLEELAGAKEDPVEITNTCATFGETEILGHLVKGVHSSRILAGINWSVARRVAQMVRRYKPKVLVFCGGVAKNTSVVEMAGQAAGCPVITPPEPQINGAFGCCLEKEPI
ncbi:acyl-CoA dehydratase activase [Dethiosulfatarculus sandiegensis]|uniref:2-hydroxyglutaryl-CoA dehydratase n=1 Tax=Dethiosulfatarculus sandiegensis TaxID=1429043 RepID=A0A0D2JV12_9BACT|nr:acyl-CoA dehydratase activase [Dethiosulfatarculus sandiegensis]KIX13390.1 2-hydroxyglutaryl-CoA dehydratase [Dethiosulfatarculus sandiegensis]